MEISIVIPSCGRNSHLNTVLSDLSRQSLDFTKWECLLILQGNSDGLEINHSFNLRIIYSHYKNANFARNVGLHYSKGKYILFLDDDIHISSSDFLLKYHNYSSIYPVGIFGQILTPPKNIEYFFLNKKVTSLSYGWLFFKPQYAKSIFISVAASGNMFLRRQFALEVNGFDENFFLGAYMEEAEFSLRYSNRHGQFIYLPDVSIIHYGISFGGTRTYFNFLKLHHLLGCWYFLFRSILNGNIKIFSFLPYLLFCFRFTFRQEVRSNVLLFLVTFFTFYLVVIFAFVLSIFPKRFSHSRIISKTVELKF
jgi:glycosyltransferase involved in cell wall biosynthesis